MKRIIFSCVAILFGVLAIGGAISVLLSDRVECGGETMRQGDVCVSKSRSGRVTASSLEETKSSTRFGAFAGIGVSVLIIVIGAQNLRIGIRNRKAEKASVPSIPWPDIPFPPQQQAAHQQQQQQQQPYSPAHQYSAPQYSAQQYPPQQQYYQPPQHQYYQPHQQPPGSGDIWR